MTPSAAKALLDQTPPARILVVQTAFLGDVVFSSPLVQALKRRFPLATLTLVVAPRGAEVARHIPGVDRVVVFDKRGADRSVFALRRIAQSVPADLAVVPHPSWRSAWLGRWAYPRISVGTAGGLRGRLFDVAVPGADGFVAAQLALGEAIGASGDPALRLELSKSELASARARLGAGPFAGLVIGSEWATKRLLPQRWAEVADLLLDRGLIPVLLGAPSERPLAEEVLSACRQRTQVIDQVGETLEQALGTLGCCEAVVGGDTGLVHAARALGIPAVAIFGPTDPRRHDWEKSTQVLSRGLACQPCHAHGPSRCPLGHHDCMRTLTAADILSKVALSKPVTS